MISSAEKEAESLSVRTFRDSGRPARSSAQQKRWKVVGSIRRRPHEVFMRDTCTPTQSLLGDSVAPVITADIVAMVSLTDNSMIGVRDRALILLGSAGGFRRAELVALDADDLGFNRDGLTVTLRRSKTDHGGRSARRHSYGSNPDTCPVRVLQSRLEQAVITQGPVFGSSSSR
jgi:integrase